MLNQFCKKYGFLFIVFAVCSVIFGMGFLVGAVTTSRAAPVAPSASVEHSPLPAINYINARQPAAPEYREITVEATAYCCENYPHICNDGDATCTATGTKPTPGRTIAVDPSVIPYGAEVIINGQTYIAEDCGGAIKGNRIDILFDTHEEALQFGRQQLTVYVAGV